MSINKQFLIIFYLLVHGFAAVAQYNGESQYQPVTADQVVHTVAATPWPVHQRGNHRAIVTVNHAGAKAVRLLLPWRRPDIDPQAKRVVIVNSATGRELSNIFIEHNTNESGGLAFEPDSLPGTYEVYYLPFHYRKTADDARYGEPWNDYLPAVYNPEQEWLSIVKASYSQLPSATVTRFEARTVTDLFTPMGLIATREEEQWLAAKATGRAMIFPEDRAFPIRLTNRLPVRWAHQQPAASFKGYTAKNEYYTLQLGVFAHQQALKNVRVQFTDLTGPAGRIAKDSFTCFNQEGIGWDGKPVRFTVDVAAGQVQALWLGLSIPRNAASGQYDGWATVTADGIVLQKVKLSIRVGNELLADRGDADLWRHARLRWLNSTLGNTDDPVSPFVALQRRGNLITASGKQLLLDQYGLPAQVITPQQTKPIAGLLAMPLQLEATTAAGRLTLTPGKLTFRDTDGKISWQSVWKGQGLQVLCKGEMAFDGTVQYSFSFHASRSLLLTNIALQLRFAKEQAPYAMGVGLEGGNLPALPYTWKWNGPWDSVWAGDVSAGLHVEFQKAAYNGPLLNDYKPGPPAAWANNGKGAVNITASGKEQVLIAATTGEYVLQPGKPLELACKLLITPVKPVDIRAHFTERYYQGNPLYVQKAAAEGANVINVHHNTSINPYINYPFVVRDSLIHYIREQHAAKRRVKLYYTIRELSNYASEIYALKSLGNELFPAGAGKGAPWLWEHLVSGYKAAWYAPFPDETADVSIVMNGFSRWINYYIEGLRWMLEQYQIDGLYLDDVAYDREVIARLRRVLLRYNPNALLDLHSNTRYSVGPANQYTAFFPYLDRLWFGESFQYNKMSPDQWLVQFSGIPFGVMSEMLQDDGNRWLGMVYGTTNRHSWGNVSPAPVWKYWDEFNIKDAKMYGYWNQDCPVTSNNDSVKITVYAHQDKWLLAVGNFSNTVQQVSPLFRSTLSGFTAGNSRMHAPAIEGFQQDTVFTSGQPFSIAPKKGWLIEIDRKQ